MLHKRECRSACSFCTLLRLSFPRILDYFFGYVRKTLPRPTDTESKRERVNGKHMFHWAFPLSRNDLLGSVVPLPYHPSSTATLLSLHYCAYQTAESSDMT